MTRKKILAVIFGTVLFLTSALPLFAVSENAFALTITPPLVKINMQPGESWSSSIKIINNNPIATSIYAQTADFKSGEDGGVVFLENNSPEEAAGHFLLSRWMNINSEAIPMAPFETKEIPVTISIPINAEAGGHYAAVLVGTKPAESKLSGSGIKTASMLASLFMLNVKGNTIEDGRIRDFFSAQDYYKEPNVSLILRFENTGNVHLQPQGQIVIYNMFGQEKDTIAINQKSDFGNVLPKSTRKWEFNWQGEKGFLASGRYRADLALSYGDQAKQSVSQTVYFWVIDVKAVATATGSILFLILLLIIAIRSYVRRAVRQAGLAVMQSSALSKVEKPQLPVIRKVEPAKQERKVDLRK